MSAQEAEPDECEEMTPKDDKNKNTRLDDGCTKLSDSFLSGVCDHPVVGCWCKLPNIVQCDVSRYIRYMVSVRLYSGALVLCYIMTRGL